MDDYIKREDAQKWLQSIRSDCGRHQDMWHYAEALDQIIELLSADVVPVRHGRWIENKEEIVCSKCTNILDARAWYRYFSYGKPSYCPNCGAKMDEEKDDEL